MAARTFTIDALITRLEQLCDIENDTHLSSAEKFSIMNSAIAETWDLLCEVGLGEKKLSSATFNSVSGTQDYDLFTIASDFYRIHSLYVNEGNGHYRPLTRINPSEVAPFKAPTSAVSLKLYYIPYSPVLTTGQSFDGINGWEEHTLMTAACAVKMKREEDYNLFYRRKKELEQRIRSAGAVDRGEPMRVSRKRKRDPFYLFNKPINAYCVRGNNLELYYYDGYIP